MRRVGARGGVVTLIIDGVKGDGITVALAGAGVTPVKISATTTFRSRQKTTVETIQAGRLHRRRRQARIRWDTDGGRDQHLPPGIQGPDPRRPVCNGLG